MFFKIISTSVFPKMNHRRRVYFSGYNYNVLIEFPVEAMNANWIVFG